MANSISIQVNPTPTASQFTSISLVGQLLNPSSVFIAQFRNDGWITLYGSVLKNGAYVLTQLTTLQAGADEIAFTFSVEVGPDATQPRAGLLVERADDWMEPWDEEIAHVLGGKSLPLGADPVPLKGSVNPNVAPRPLLTGTFTGPAAGGTRSELTIAGISRISKTTIDPLKTGTTAAKSLSLWLPAGTAGAMEVVRSQGTEVHRYTTKDISG
jgi:hypothetical protein